MKNIKTLGLIAAIALCAPSSWAALNAPGSVEGTVKDISNNMITISSDSASDLSSAANSNVRIDADNAADMDMSFRVNDQTQLGDFSALSDIEEGDRVRVSFTEGDNNQKVATLVQRHDASSDVYRSDSMQDRMDDTPNPGMSDKEYDPSSFQNQNPNLQDNDGTPGAAKGI